MLVTKTSDAYHLDKVYFAADRFINPIYEDNYPTVNLEAIAYSTYNITCDTGYCMEILYGK